MSARFRKSIVLGSLAALGLWSIASKHSTSFTSHSGLNRSVSSLAHNINEKVENSNKTISNDKELRKQEHKKTQVLLFEGDIELSENRLAFQQIFEDTSRKYPLTLVQQVWRVSADDPTQKEFLGERKMVADHLLVRLHSREQENSFESIINGLGMKIRKKMMSGLYIIEFQIEGHDTLKKTQKLLQDLSEVRSVSPDFISQAVF